MQFQQVQGQQRVKNQLTQMVSGNRLSHALLFLGKEGSGALELAIALAQWMVCEKNNSNLASPNMFADEKSQTDDQTDSCGVCASCRKASSIMHPDIHYSFPTITRTSGDKPVSSDFIEEWRSFIQQTPFGNAYDWLQSIGAENKQGNITAHECEDILRKLHLKSFESGYKILIQWMPEYLGNAGNKLLKMIEEPPDKTLFILVAEDESKILPTIISRTQLVKINQLSTQEVEDWLITKQAVPKDKAVTLAPLAQGNLREAFQMIHHGDEDWQALLRDWLNAMLKNGPSAQVKWIDEISKLGREKQKQFLLYFIHLISVAMHLENTGTIKTASETEIDFAQRIVKLASTPQLEIIVHELNNAMYSIERNANPKMLFMALTIKIYHIIKDKSLISIN